MSPDTAAALGKIAPGVYEALIAPHLGAARPEVLVGPGPGRDSAILKIGAGRVMAVTTDPLSLVPAWGLERSARLACHLLASDLWTSGIPPAFASVSLHLPRTLGNEDLGRYWRAMSEEWAKLEVAVVAGHTGRYAGLDSTIIGAATLMGIGDDGRYLTPAMARPGDRVIVTKGCAIETTAVAAHLFPRRLAQGLEPDALERAKGFAGLVSVVRECRAALRVGVRERGVTAMHDATEGGVLGGLVELARASGHDLRVDRARIPLSPEAAAACEAFGIDPYWALSEGTLIATVAPARATEVIEAIAEEDIVVADVGEVLEGDGALWLTGPDGAARKLRTVEPDPYWPAYERAISERWT
jgi:hydrogenase maturation factor